MAKKKVAPIGKVDPNPKDGFLKDVNLSPKITTLIDAAHEALLWIESKTKGHVIDCKDSLRIALYGTLRGERPSMKVETNARG